MYIKDSTFQTPSGTGQGTSCTNRTTLFLGFYTYSTQLPIRRENFIFRLENCSCKVEKLTSMTAYSPAWLSPLIADLIAQHIHTMTLLSVQFTHGCFRILNLKVSSVTDLSFPNSPWLGRTLHCVGKEAEMLSHPVIELTPIRALMKQWLTLPGRVAEKVLFCWSSSPRSTFHSQGFATSKQ